MIKNQLFTFILIISAAFVSCDNGKKESEAKLHEEVMAVHDKVMPKMAELNRLKKQLKSYKETIAENNVELKDSVLNAILLLSKSEDLMNDWMANYKYPNQDAKHEELLTYLKAQKDTISHVSDDIFMSIAIAQGFLKNMPDSLKPAEPAKAEDHSQHH